MLEFVFEFAHYLVSFLHEELVLEHFLKVATGLRSIVLSHHIIFIDNLMEPKLYGIEFLLQPINKLFFGYGKLFEFLFLDV